MAITLKMYTRTSRRRVSRFSVMIPMFTTLNDVSRSFAITLDSVPFRFALPNFPSTGILSISSWRRSFLAASIPAALSSVRFGGRPRGGPDRRIPRPLHHARLARVL